MKKTSWTKDQAIEKLSKWCAEQERCHFDARTKLIEHQVYGEDLENVLSHLITEGFLNEQRYAIAYVSGKVKMNRWGLQKVKLGLKQKKVSDYCIRKAINAIDMKYIYDNLDHLIAKKGPLINASNEFVWKKKMSAFLLQRGYSYQDFTDLLNQYFLDVKS